MKKYKIKHIAENHCYCILERWGLFLYEPILYKYTLEEAKESVCQLMQIDAEIKKFNNRTQEPRE